MLRLLIVCSAGLAVANELSAKLNIQPSDAVVSLFDEKVAADKVAVEHALNSVYESFLRNFDVNAHHHLMEQIEGGIESFLESKAATSYKTIPSQPHCDSGVSAVPSRAVAVKAMSAFPGGPLKRLFGFDLAKLTDKLASSAKGPAGAGAAMGPMLAIQALNMGMGMVKGAVHMVLQIVPPMIPPPVWVNKPMPCLPMVTGSICFGATPYLITAADFIQADTVDSGLSGILNGFPAMYKEKVGKTSDAAYKKCFMAYMSMQCAAAFPRCASDPMAREEMNNPVGRVPICFTHCLATLVMCPGFWIDDIIGECQNASIPPMCTTALFWNTALLPPQYQSFEDSAPTPLECPTVPNALKTLDATSDFSLYDASETAVAGSPYADATAVKVPGA